MLIIIPMNMDLVVIIMMINKQIVINILITIIITNKIIIINMRNLNPNIRIKIHIRNYN
jgi:hypothetical protein